MCLGCDDKESNECGEEIGRSLGVNEDHDGHFYVKNIGPKKNATNGYHNEPIEHTD